MTDFATRARAAMQKQGLSVRAAARALNYDHAFLSRVLNGKQRPSVQLAQGLDQLLGTGGALAVLVTPLTDDDRARIAYSVAAPSRIDAGTVRALGDALAAQRRLDDSLGSAAVLPTAHAQLTTISTLAKEARGVHRTDMINVAAQWAVFGGWLATAVGRYTDAGAWFDRAIEWSAEADDATLSATTWSFKAYLAGQCGNSDSMVGLANVARRVPGVHPSQRTYSTLQAARGYALLGDRDQARRILAQADDLLDTAAAAGAPPEATYWNERPFFQLYIGRTCLALGDHADAVAYLRAGLDALPADQRNAQWCMKYGHALEKAQAAA